MIKSFCNRQVAPYGKHGAPPFNPPYIIPFAILYSLTYTITFFIIETISLSLSCFSKYTLTPSCFNPSKNLLAEAIFNRSVPLRDETLSTSLASTIKLISVLSPFFITYIKSGLVVPPKYKGTRTLLLGILPNTTTSSILLSLISSFSLGLSKITLSYKKFSGTDKLSSFIIPTIPCIIFSFGSPLISVRAVSKEST